MRLSPAQQRVMRAGGVLLLATALLLVAAFVALGTTGEPSVKRAESLSEVSLPDAGLFGGAVTVYGNVDEGTGFDIGAHGCSLVADSGTDRGAVKLSTITVLGADLVEVDGEELAPLFEVRRWADGDVVRCASPSGISVVALSSPTLFGSLAGPVRWMSLGAAVLCLVVGLVGLGLGRRRP